MIRIEQLITVPGPDFTGPEDQRYGDCVRASLSSVFELDINTVPNFSDPTVHDGAGSWWLCLKDYCEDKLFIEIDAVDPNRVTRHRRIVNPPAGYSLMVVESLRGPWHHTVVAYDGECVWDPHPNRAKGNGPLFGYIYFMPTTMKQHMLLFNR